MVRRFAVDTPLLTMSAGRTPYLCSLVTQNARHKDHGFRPAKQSANSSYVSWMMGDTQRILAYLRILY